MTPLPFQTLAATLPSVASPNDVNITRLEFVAGRRILRRTLATPSIVVHYQLFVNQLPK